MNWWERCEVMPPDVNKCLIWKDPDTGKDLGGRRGQQRMRCLDGITESVNMSLSKVRGWWMNRGAHCASVHVVAKRRTWLSDWTELLGPDAMIFVFWMLSFKPVFSLFSFTFIKRLFPLHFLPWGWYHWHICGYWYFSRQSWFQLVLHPAQNFTWCTLHIS